MNTEFTFRADASITIGTGHVMRCLTLADALSAHGARVCFVCTPETPDIVPKLRQSGYAIAPDLTKGDVLIVDHYGLDIEFERSARQQYHHLMVIDDLPHRPHLCDILLDQTFGRTKDQWQPLLPQSAQILAGTEYLLLRPEFKMPTPNRHSLRSVLVTLGGTDPDNVTATVLDGIAQSGLDLDIHVVMGQQAPHLESILAQIGQLKRGHLHINADNMPHLMAQADLAIGAGGTTAWERCSLGLPTIMLQIADNQKDVVSALVQAGAAVQSAITAHAIAAHLVQLHQAPDLLSRLSQAARQICSGNGTETVAQILLNLLRDPL